jgi:hypothetical protein
VPRTSAFTDFAFYPECIYWFHVILTSYDSYNINLCRAEKGNLNPHVMGLPSGLKTYGNGSAVR